MHLQISTDCKSVPARGSGLLALNLYFTHWPGGGAAPGMNAEACNWSFSNRKRLIVSFVAVTTEGKRRP
jgi:hypothetical protein